MKKWLCLLLVGLFLLGCTACGGEGILPDGSSAGPSSLPSPEKPEFTTESEVFIYTVAGISEGEGKSLTVTDKTSGKTVQTIRLTENEWFTKDPLYLADVTFDGNDDILVPFSRPASGAFFQAYVWNAETGRYEHAPSFENLPNVAADAETGMLLSHRTADKITAYSMYQYRVEKNDFIPGHSLHWEPQEDGRTLCVTQTDYAADGIEEQTSRFSVSAVSIIDVDKTDARMAPYFSDGSLWDLDGDRWNSTVIPVSEYTY